jgi:hypothetical protein
MERRRGKSSRITLLLESESMWSRTVGLGPKQVLLDDRIVGLDPGQLKIPISHVRLGKLLQNW